MNQVSARLVFFDLGDTLVRRSSVSPSGFRFAWVAGAKGMLRKLREAGLHLGILSNTGTLTRNQLLARLPDDFTFDVFDQTLVILSSEVGPEKPDPRIFRLATNRAQRLPDPEINLQCDAGNCVFCGESMQECIAAQQVGMIAVRLNLHPSPEISALDSHLRQAGLLN